MLQGLKPEMSQPSQSEEIEEKVKPPSLATQTFKRIFRSIVYF